MYKGVLYDIQDITVGDEDGICLNEEYNFGSDMATIEQIKEYVEGQENFECYIKHVEQFFEANEIDEKKQVAMLLTVIGAPTYGLLKNLVAPESPSSLKFEDLVGHFSPKPSVIAEQFKFHGRYQGEGGSMS